MSEDLEKLRLLIRLNPDLCRELAAITASDHFVSRLVEIGRENSVFTEREEIMEAMCRSRRVLIEERWR